MGESVESWTVLLAALSINCSWGEQHWPLYLCLGNQSWIPQALCCVTTEPPIPTMPLHINKDIVTSAPLGPFSSGPWREDRGWALGCRKPGQGRGNYTLEDFWASLVWPFLSNAASQGCLGFTEYCLSKDLSNRTGCSHRLSWAADTLGHLPSIPQHL